MEIDPFDNTDWLLDYGYSDDISIVSAGDFLPPDLSTLGFSWPADPPLNCSPSFSAEVGFLHENSDDHKQPDPSKGFKSGSASSGSKACREKLRRDRLNERFQELSSVLEPGRPPKADKSAILSDAVRTVTQLRSEAHKLKEEIEDLQEKIKELKIEKSELRDEKQKLKADKEKLELHVKALGAHPGYIAHHPVMGATFSPQGQASPRKMTPFVSYPNGGAMWRFMSPTVVDTSQDHVLRPPVA